MVRMRRTILDKRGKERLKKKIRYGTVFNGVRYERRSLGC
jgi:hypothetical protein